MKDRKFTQEIFPWKFRFCFVFFPLQAIWVIMSKIQIQHAIQYFPDRILGIRDVLQLKPFFRSLTFLPFVISLLLSNYLFYPVP